MRKLAAPPNPLDSVSVSMPATPQRFGRRSVSPAREMIVSDKQDGWLMAVELVTATLVWGGIGYALDRWVFGTEPVLMSIGFVVGFFAGMYLLWLKTSRPVTTAAEGEGADDAGR